MPDEIEATKPKHTPTPWTYHVSSDSCRSWIKDAEGTAIVWGDSDGLTFSSPAVREQLLEAVNSHAALLAERDGLRSIAERIYCDRDFRVHVADELIDELKAALTPPAAPPQRNE